MCPSGAAGALASAAVGALFDDGVQNRGGLQGVAMVRTENAPLCLETGPEELLGIVEPTQLAQKGPQRRSSSRSVVGCSGPRT